MLYIVVISKNHHQYHQYEKLELNSKSRQYQILGLKVLCKCKISESYNFQPRTLLYNSY